MKTVLAAFKNGTSGTLSVWTALAAVPMLSAVTFTLDLQAAIGQRDTLKAAVDTAVLAAVNHNGLTESQKEAFAVDTFTANYKGTAKVTAKLADATPNRVGLRVEAEFPKSISAALGAVSIDVDVQSEAVLNEEETICVLALDENADGAISFIDDVSYVSPTCSVHSNSTSDIALLATTSGYPSAKTFCAPGGASGYFSPAANGECRVVEDPYADLRAPVVGNCASTAGFASVSTLGAPKGSNGRGGVGFAVAPGLNQAAADVRGTVQPPGLMGLLARLNDGRSIELKEGDSENIVDNNTTLSPGTYCGGITIAGRNVTLLPGQYYMRGGAFVVKDEATVEGDGVTVALGGPTSVIRVETKGSLRLSAPRTGAHAGVAVMEDVRAPNSVMIKGMELMLPDPPPSDDPVYPVSRVNDGALNLAGTIYLPSHTLVIEGPDSDLGAQAPSTSLIVGRAHFMGAGTVEIEVDHRAANLPPVLPRSEEGARLVR